MAVHGRLADSCGKPLANAAVESAIAQSAPQFVGGTDAQGCSA
jgi:hypothetical protein